MMRWEVKQQERDKKESSLSLLWWENIIGAFAGVCYRPEELGFDEDSAYWETILGISS